ncbi:MAG: hypothetical protein SBU_000326 [Candidatus Syntrophoarchaeum butanivorans]|uniref:Uncharacterized protein n=1 Tax=Candidatus Syntropharchaeum butanivorans TaxID=1839936 RepID=A0A1F2P769_9EURY|nr:MAG: hypothetical protein SBU_000326 [Candidatus Syntrophoarchaeum butanivorans]
MGWGAWSTGASRSLQKLKGPVNLFQPPPSSPSGCTLHLPPQKPPSERGINRYLFIIQDKRGSLWKLCVIKWETVRAIHQIRR